MKTDTSDRINVAAFAGHSIGALFRRIETARKSREGIMQAHAAQLAVMDAEMEHMEQAYRRILEDNDG